VNALCNAFPARISRFDRRWWSEETLNPRSKVDNEKYSAERI
jgi:hypothetical protein